MNVFIGGLGPMKQSKKDDGIIGVYILVYTFVDGIEIE